MYTQEENRSTRLAREKDVYRYTTALESGDIDTLAVLWHKAQHDATLEAMLLETQSFYMNEGLRARAIDADIAAEVLETVLPTPAAVQEEMLNGDRHHNYRKRQSPMKRVSRVGRFVQSLAAVLVVGLIVGGFLVLFSTRHTATEGINTTSTKPVKWHIVSSPDGPQAFSTLYSVVALSATDVWAVGANASQPVDNSPQMVKGEQALIEHWNGSQWSIVPSPKIGTQGNNLSSVAAISANNVWAIGYYANSSNPNTGYTLIEHWNGSKWSIVASPNPGPNNTLNAIAAVSPDDIWVVGGITEKNSGQRSFFEHWNGSQWQVVPSPHTTLENNFLLSISAVSSTNIWAVGSSGNSTYSEQRTLTEHWNGSQWQVVPSPSPAQFYNALWGVTTVSANNIWAVGGIADTHTTPAKTLIEHWNGTSWSVVPSPSAGNFQDVLYGGVTAISANNIWAIGWTATNQNFTTWQPLVEHWDGKHWSLVSSPHAGISRFINGITTVPVTNQLWVVGSTYPNNNKAQTLTELGTF